MSVPCLELNSGNKMPALGLGTWKSKVGEVGRAVECAIDSGYRHIDCAWIYSNEGEVGEAIAKKIRENIVKREDLFVTSKLWNSFHDPKDVRKGLEETLKNLKLDYLDLYLIHWPQGYPLIGTEKFPRDTDGNMIHSDVDYVATWKVLEAIKKEGIVRNIGVSNFNEFQLNRVLKEGSILPAVQQIEINPYLAQNEMAELCKKHGIVVTAYSPLGSPDRPWAKPDEPHLLEDPVLKEIASRLNKSPAQVLIRYQLQRGFVVIPKSVTPSRIKQNFEVFDFKLTDEDFKKIESFDRNFRACEMTMDFEHKYFPFRENYSE